MPVLISLLVKHGVDVNSIVNGYSPMALAIINGHDSVRSYKVLCLRKARDFKDYDSHSYPISESEE